MPASIARIELRKPILQDASDWYSTMYQPETIPYLYDGFCDLDEAGLRAQFSMPRPSHWFSIYEMSSGEFLGFCGLSAHAAFDGSMDAFYYLRSRHFGKGYATEAIKELLRIADAQGISFVTAISDSRNSASIRAAERAGMAHLGDLPNSKKGLIMSLYAFPDQPHIRAQISRLD